MVSDLVVVVGGVFGYFGCAVDLLGHDETSDGMWKHKVGKAPEEVGLCAGVIGEAVGATD